MNPMTSAWIDTRDPDAVMAEARRAYAEMFSDADPEFIERSFGWLKKWFTGSYKDYLPIDAGYHDMEHTLQGTLCLVRLLHGRHKAGAEPRFDRHMFELALMAIMMHDTGYLKHHWDTEGTGAKYTLIHIDRSGAFAKEFLSEQGYDESDIRAVRNMIYCTGVAAKMEEIPFIKEEEVLLGCVVATSDLLGQMAAGDYLEKLDALFEEFRESSDYHADRPGYVHRFKSLDQLLKDSPGFWTHYVIPKIENHCRGMYRFLSDPYPDGPNVYIERIEANIEAVRKKVEECSN